MTTELTSPAPDIDGLRVKSAAIANNLKDSRSAARDFRPSCTHIGTHLMECLRNKEII
jgi:hypothetical protein